MSAPIRPLQSGDVISWPCGTWCFFEDLGEMTHKSDDYQVLREGDQETEDFLVSEYST